MNEPNKRGKVNSKTIHINSSYNTNCNHNNINNGVMPMVMFRGQEWVYKVFIDEQLAYPSKNIQNPCKVIEDYRSEGHDLIFQYQSPADHEKREIRMYFKTRRNGNGSKL